MSDVLSPLKTKRKPTVKGVLHKTKKVTKNTVEMVGSTVADGTKLVESTHIGGVLVGGTKLVGGTLIDGTKLVGGTIIDGTKLVGGTLMAGGDMVAGGIKHLVGEDELNDSAFFHNDPNELDDYDDDFDEMLPKRFVDETEKKHVPKTPVFKVEWDNGDWGEFDGDPDTGLLKITKKKASTKKNPQKRESASEKGKPQSVSKPKKSFKGLEVVAEEVEKPNNEVEVDTGDNGSLMSANTNDDDDIYLDEEDIKAKAADGMKPNEEDDNDEFDTLQGELLSIFENGKPKKGLSPKPSMVKEVLPAVPSFNRKPRASIFSTMVTDSTLGVEGQDDRKSQTDIQIKIKAKGLWSKVRQSVKTESAVNEMIKIMTKNEEFFNLMEEEEGAGGDPVEEAAKALREERAKEKQRVKTLLHKLNEYESNLTVERKKVKEERIRVSEEKVNLEAQLKEELEKNAGLENQLRVIEEQLNSESQRQRDMVFEREGQELRAENDVLQQQLGKQDQILRHLHREKAQKEKEAKERQEKQEEDLDDLAQDDVTIATFVTRKRAGGSQISMVTMQNDLTDMSVLLNSRNEIIQGQLQELETLKAEILAFEEAHGIKPLKEKLKELNEEKRILEENCQTENNKLRKELSEKEKITAEYAKEISKVKLEMTQRELRSNRLNEQIAAESSAEMSESQGGGFLGLLFGSGRPADETSDADLALSKLGL
jgi:hypothetical protein